MSSGNGYWWCGSKLSENFLVTGEERMRPILWRGDTLRLTNLAFTLQNLNIEWGKLIGKDKSNTFRFGGKEYHVREHQPLTSGLFRHQPLPGVLSCKEYRWDLVYDEGHYYANNNDCYLCTQHQAPSLSVPVKFHEMDRLWEMTTYGPGYGKCSMYMSDELLQSMVDNTSRSVNLKDELARAEVDNEALREENEQLKERLAYYEMLEPDDE